MDRMAPDRRIDSSRPGPKPAGDEREISLLHRARGELPGKFAMCGVVLRHDKASARFLVEAMHDARPLLSTDTGKRGAMMQEGVDQRVLLVARAGMHDHSR